MNYVMMPLVSILQAFLLVDLTRMVTGDRFFFTSHGAFNNSCRVAQCNTCNIGEYRVGCANSSGGICAKCTPITGASFITHGWFNNSCGFQCNEGFVLGHGRSCKNVSMQYTVNFVASVTLLNGSNNIFNLTTYIAAVAKLAGCGVCASSRLNPTKCGACAIHYVLVSSIPVVYRRLLSSGSLVEVNTSIVVYDNKPLAVAAVANINSSVINSILVNANIGTVSIDRTPTLRSTIVLSSTPTPPTPPSPPSETLKPEPSITPPQVSSSGDSNTAVIIGGIVGGFVGLVIIIIIVAIMMKKGNNGSRATEPSTASNNLGASFTRGDGSLNTVPKHASRFAFVRKHQYNN